MNLARVWAWTQWQRYTYLPFGVGSLYFWLESTKTIIDVNCCWFWFDLQASCSTLFVSLLQIKEIISLSSNSLCSNTEAGINDITYFISDVPSMCIEHSRTIVHVVWGMRLPVQSVIGLPIYAFLLVLMFNINIWPNSFMSSVDIVKQS